MGSSRMPYSARARRSTSSEIQVQRFCCPTVERGWRLRRILFGEVAASPVWSKMCLSKVFSSALRGSRTRTERMSSTRSKTPMRVASPLNWKSKEPCEAQRGRLWVMTGFWSAPCSTRNQSTPSVVHRVSRRKVAVGGEQADCE
ncbi:MAG: hypothetical protein BWZ02_02601 [Lentisphaerae bacterium ADurb.BinA184]|nr:MAG: hypothetical protein BWZ02_02601 [Lentisphaerae bacterium ADurb.BinA184]